MPVDPGVRDAYLSALGSEIDRRQNELGRVREQLKTARLEAAATSSLPASTTSLLAAAGLTGKLDLPALQARRDELQSEIQAIGALADAAKGVA